MGEGVVRGATQVVWGHFHAILEAFQLAGRPQCHGGKFRQQLPERNQPPGQRILAAPGARPRAERLAQERTLPIACAAAPSARRRTRARHRGRAPASARRNRRATCISSRAVSPSNARISSRFTVTATAFGPRVRLDLAPAREVVRSLAVDVLGGVNGRRLIECCPGTGRSPHRAGRASDVDRLWSRSCRTRRTSRSCVRTRWWLRRSCRWRSGTARAGSRGR